ncbi:MAG: CD225/dispanin family protein [Akkermansiaceae bacterium]
MQWYYSKNGTQLGPIAEAELRSKLATGEISQTDLAWREGMGDWLPVAKIPELSTPPAGSLREPVEASPYQTPAAGQASYAPGVVIPNYLWQAIVVTIFCCWPFGIPAIVYAAKVDTLRATGDIQGAMAASASAKTWCIVAAGVWLVLIVVWLLFVGVAAIFSN